MTVQPNIAKKISDIPAWDGKITNLFYNILYNFRVILMRPDSPFKINCMKKWKRDRFSAFANPSNWIAN
jgi:hypothetical protein